MAIEAEIGDVTRPGENISVLVIYRDQGIEISRETLTFDASVVTSPLVIQSITARGQKIQASKSGEILAKGLIGQKIPIS